MRRDPAYPLACPRSIGRRVAGSRETKAEEFAGLTLRLYMDHHVPSAVTQGLRLRGVDVLTCHEDGTSELDDASLLARATELGRVLFTQDADFLVAASEWQESGREFVGMLYGHQLQLTMGQAVRDLELAAEILERDDTRNRVEYLPL